VLKPKRDSRNEVQMPDRISARKTAGAKRPDWRSFQDRLKKKAAYQKTSRRVAKYSLCFLLAAIAIYAFIEGFDLRQGEQRRSDSVRLSIPKDSHGKNKVYLAKKDIQPLLSTTVLLNQTKDNFTFHFDGQPYSADTSLDASLQGFLLNRLDTKNARYIGIVVMSPATGKILSMAGYDRIDPKNNPCTDNIFPAASIFKIISAAAAIEKGGLHETSEFSYTGQKYTLYKQQLDEQKSTSVVTTTTFRNAFAQSINPVFGKIGTNLLGRAVLENYARRFGFNQSINFEIPIAPSIFAITDDPYRWAEIATGFNREVTLSPVHGAMLVSSILNNGMLIEPSIIDQIRDGHEQTIYRSRTVKISQAIKPESSRLIRAFMEETVKSGTCRKIFRNRHQDKILTRLDIGGKTGSINNKTRDARIDWFVGFAREKDGEGELVVSVVVAHEKYIGTRAGQYAQKAIKYYYNNYFSKSHKSHSP